MSTGNILLQTDCYKMGHMHMYPEGTTKVYSYLCARSLKMYPYAVFFGLSYFLQEYLSKHPTLEDVEEFMQIRDSILGPDSLDTRKKLNALVDLGYWPIKIEAVREGAIIPNGNVLATFENTHPDFPWVVGFLESLFLKVWNMTTVATASLYFKQIALEFARDTSDDQTYIMFQVHDFGYRGCSSEETAQTSGMAHILNFYGTDTVPAVWAAKKYYRATYPVGLSVPATEHSVMCAFGQEHEWDAFDYVMEKYPHGILSIVSDTYNVWSILQNYTRARKEKILARDGKIVFRPDGGYPPHIIAGDPDAIKGTPEYKGAIELLWDVFGGTVNDKGFKELDEHVGLIYGEGMTHARFRETLTLLKEKGFAANNLVIGVGGLLLQRHTRDDLGFALKATYAEVNGEHRDLMKNPITSPNKKSHSGRLRLVKSETGYATVPWVEGEDTGLTLYYRDGRQTYFPEFDEIRARIKYEFADLK